MPVDQVAGIYRLGLVDTVILLLFFILAFGVLTLGGRQVFTALAPRESLLTRLAAAVLLASLSMSGASYVVDNILQPTYFSPGVITADTARNQTILGIAIALAITIVAVIRIELYNRARTSPAASEGDADWKVEPPEAAGGR